MDRLLALVGLGRAGGESTTQEQYHDPIALHHVLRVRQWVAAILANLACFGGLTLIGVPLVLSGAVDTWLDGALMGCLSFIAGLLWFSAVELSLSKSPRVVRRLAEMLGDMLILAAIVILAVRLGDLRWWYGYAIVVGVSVLLPSLGLAFNQSRELFDPMGWTSPYEQAFLALFGKLLGMEVEQPKLVERPLFPWRHGTRKEHLSAMLPEGKEGVIDIPASDDLSFADFLEEAIKRGLGRRQWLGKGQARFTCPSTGERVTRTVYDKMLRMAARMGYVDLGGDGDATRFVSSAEAARDDWCTRMEDEWGDMLDGGDDE